MKYYKKNKRLWNCLILILIIYFLNTYDILSAISFNFKDYFWLITKDNFGKLSDIIVKLNTYTLFSKGVIAGVIVYLCNTYRLQSEKLNYDLFFTKKDYVKKFYLDNIILSFKVISIPMLIFICFFLFFTKIDILGFLKIIIINVNIILYIFLLWELSLFLSRHFKLFKNNRYLVEFISFIVILIEIYFQKREFSLLFSSSMNTTIILLILDLLGYFFLKKKKYFTRNYDCIYFLTKIK